MDVLEMIGGIGNTVAQKAGELAEVGRINLNIRKYRKDARDLEFALGKYVYELSKNGHKFEDEEINEKCRSIGEAYSEIEKLNAEKEAVGGDVEVEVVDVDVIPNVDDEDFDAGIDDELLENLDTAE